ncbi:MAG: site-specific integrase [Clostridia bacterium]|jgi:integrase|nr:site-specific integrase [Clostridia bacterium]MCI2014028.1 site-specific integrase [Clostridia bacterium]
MKTVRVKKRGNLYQYEFELGMVSGKRKTCTKSGFATEEEAYNAGIKAMSEYNATGTIYKPSDMALIDYLDWWYKRQIETDKRPNTQIKYKTAIDTFIRPSSIANIKLKNLTPLTIDKWINQAAQETYMSNGINKNYSQSTINGAFNLMKGALKYAVYPSMYIKENPAIYVKPPKVSKPTEKRNIISVHDFNVICEKFPRLKVSLMVGFYTGMRIGEICALTWPDIDMDNRIIHVSKQLNLYKGKYMFAEPKTQTSNRDIFFGETLFQYFKTLKKQQAESRLKYGEYYIMNVINENNTITPAYANSVAGKKCADFVVCQQGGKFYHSKELQHYDGQISDILGYKFSFHCLRHTHATMLLEAGVDMKLVQERLGHSSIVTTADTYSHTTKSMAKNVAGKLDSFLQTDCGQVKNTDIENDFADKMQTN